MITGLPSQVAGAATTPNAPSAPPGLASFFALLGGDTPATAVSAEGAPLAPEGSADPDALVEFAEPTESPLVDGLFAQLNLPVEAAPSSSIAGDTVAHRGGSAEGLSTAMARLGAVLQHWRQSASGAALSGPAEGHSASAPGLTSLPGPAQALPHTELPRWQPGAAAVEPPAGEAGRAIPLTAVAESEALLLPAENRAGMAPEPPPLTGATFFEGRGGAELRAPVPAAPAPQPLPIDAELDSALEGQLRWQIEAGQSEAMIELHPAELGALTIRIQLVGDQASVMILAAEAATRQLLQQVLPQLGERLMQSGLGYAGGQVGTRSASSGDGESAGSEDDRGVRGVRRIGLRELMLVDAWA